MQLSARIIRQMLLLTLLALIVPMVIFPERLGMDLVKASFLNAMFELVFYGVVLYFLNRKLNLVQLVQASAVCLVYRFGMGLLFGLLVVAMYPMNVSIAISLGMSSYLPAILLHIAATPFILKPVMDSQFGKKQSVIQPERAPEKPTAKVSIEDSGSMVFTTSKNVKRPSESPRITPKFESPKAESVGHADNGFDMATRYIGEDGSVIMAAVIDNEGLMLGNFTRGDFEAEDIAPFGLEILKTNDYQLRRIGFVKPEKLEYQFEGNKIIIASEQAYKLMVMSERTVDDVLNIRINQALEIIRKYVAERYSEELVGNAERIYV